MVFIWGHKYELEFKGTVKQCCPSCGKSPMEPHWGKKKFTMYWIPTFTLESSYVLKCKPCDKIWTIPQAEGDRLLSQA